MFFLYLFLFLSMGIVGFQGSLDAMQNNDYPEHSAWVVVEECIDRVLTIGDLDSKKQLIDLRVKYGKNPEINQRIDDVFEMLQSSQTDVKKSSLDDDFDEMMPSDNEFDNESDDDVLQEIEHKRIGNPYIWLQIDDASEANNATRLMQILEQKDNLLNFSQREKLVKELDRVLSLPKKS